MGKIIEIKTKKDGKVAVEIEMTYEEILQLKGRVKDIFVFSEDTSEIKTNLAQRGTNEATKYFLIPKELRENLKLDGKVKCQKIESDLRFIFVFMIDKVLI